MGLNMKVNGLMRHEKEMDAEFKYGLMAQFTKDIGKMEWHMEQGGLFTQMVIFKTVNGKKVKPTDSGGISMQMVLDMKENG